MVTSTSDFVKFWQSSSNVKEVAQKTGMSTSECSAKASQLRKKGVPLKKFKRSEKENYDELAKLVEALNEEKEKQEEPQINS